MTISKEAVEAAARALAPGINWDNGLEPGPYKKMALEDAELALTAALPHLAEPQICGACGDPWTGQTCGQKDNGWPHPTCLPVSAQHLAEPSESDRDRIKEACSDCRDFKDGQRECCRAWDCDFVIDAIAAIRAEHLAQSSKSDEERAAEYVDWYAETKSSFEPMKRDLLTALTAVRAEASAAKDAEIARLLEALKRVRAKTLDECEAIARREARMWGGDERAMHASNIVANAIAALKRRR